ncbi:MAG: hypothetical protein Q9160_007781 [Pyrenula sp. 1 TL-2023]
MAYLQSTAPPPHPFVLHSPYSRASSSKRESTEVPDPTTRVLPTDAAALVSAFLKRSTVDPAYRPDSILSARGPQATSTSVANPNLTLHNLGKVRDGMLGKRAKRGDTDAKLGFFGHHGQNAAPAASSQKRKVKDNQDSVAQDKYKRRKNEEKNKGGDEMTLAEAPQVAEAAAENEDEGWQDLETFEREQEVKEGEMGDRDLDPGDAQAEPEEVAIADPMNVDETPDGALKKKYKKDKKEKKKAKDQEAEIEPAETQLPAQATPKTKAEKDERKSSKKERRKEEKKERQQTRIAAKAGEEKEEEGKRKEKSKKGKP